jgi:hypothetical protein
MTEFLFLNNLLTNQQFVVNETVDFKTDASSLFEYLKTQLESSTNNSNGPIYRLDVQEDTAIIYSITENIKKGYIWTDKTLKRTNLYNLKKISKFVVPAKQPLFLSSPVVQYNLNNNNNHNHIQYGAGYSNNLLSKQSFSPQFSEKSVLSDSFKIELLDRIKLLREKYIVDDEESSDETNFSDESSIVKKND